MRELTTPTQKIACATVGFACFPAAYGMLYKGYCLTEHFYIPNSLDPVIWTIVSVAGLGVTGIAGYIIYGEIRNMIRYLKSETKCCSLIKLAFIHANIIFWLTAIMMFFAFCTMMFMLLVYDAWRRLQQ